MLIDPDSAQSLVAQWDEVMLEAIRAGAAKPTATTYQLHLTTAAMYDAWAAYDSDAYGHYSEIIRPVGEHTDLHKAEAISFAAYRMLIAFFPDQAPLFDAFMATLGLDPATTGTDPSSASGVGNLAAQNVFAARAGDGSNFENGYADTSGYTPVNSADPDAANAPGGVDFDPNRWQPLRVPTGTVVDENGIPIIDPDDPSSYTDQGGLTPQWGDLQGFGLQSGDQFRPPAPPQLGDQGTYVDGQGNVTTGDQAYRDQIAQVIAFSATLDNEGKVIAEYWADGPRTESPPGHWNQIAQDIALREGHGIDEDIKLFFALNASLFDAGIATWEAKYQYDYIRPQSAIRHLYYDQDIASWGGPNEGTQIIAGQEWQPYQNVTFVTPPFPEFVSGHSTFSMAAAKTIAAIVGSDLFYDGTSLSNYDLDHVDGTDLLGQYVATSLAFENWEGGDPVILQWDTLTEAAQEAGLSRLYGGIHMMDGNLFGLELGEQLAAQAEIRWEALFTRGGNDNIKDNGAGNLIIAGAGNDLVRGRGGNDVIEGGTGRDRLKGGAGHDTLLGEEGRDKLYGGGGSDLLLGGGDWDVLFGGKGADVLEGGDGGDLLTGGDGNDILSGGDGGDILTGGKGADQFVFHADEAGLDTINDFNDAVDTILLYGFGDDAALSAHQIHGRLYLFIDYNPMICLKDADIDDITEGENLFFVDHVQMDHELL